MFLRICFCQFALGKAINTLKREFPFLWVIRREKCSFRSGHICFSVSVVYLKGKAVKRNQYLPCTRCMPGRVRIYRDTRSHTILWRRYGYDFYIVTTILFVVKCSAFVIISFVKYVYLHLFVIQVNYIRVTCSLFCTKKGFDRAHSLF